tara:strand:+ start:407 stop:526 length:120 start_codon:yes stop_codon:yes gene_type:complete
MLKDLSLKKDHDYIKKIKINRRSVASKNTTDKGDKYGNY